MDEHAIWASTLLLNTVSLDCGVNLLFEDVILDIFPLYWPNKKF